MERLLYLETKNSRQQLKHNARISILNKSVISDDHKQKFKLNFAPKSISKQPPADLAQSMQFSKNPLVQSVQDGIQNLNHSMINIQQGKPHIDQSKVYGQTDLTTQQQQHLVQSSLFASTAK